MKDIQKINRYSKGGVVKAYTREKGLETAITKKIQSTLPKELTKLGRHEKKLVHEACRDVLEIKKDHAIAIIAEEENFRLLEKSNTLHEIESQLVFENLLHVDRLSQGSACQIGDDFSVSQKHFKEIDVDEEVRTDLNEYGKAMNKIALNSALKLEKLCISTSPIARNMEDKDGY